MTLEEAYQAELRREADRNYQYYKYGKGRNEVPLEANLPEDQDADDPAWVSDGGKGLDIMLDELDFSTIQREKREKLRAAIKKVLAEAPQCLYTFLLIIKNGPNRKESIWQIAKRIAKYGVKRGLNTRTIRRHLQGFLCPLFKKS